MATVELAICLPVLVLIVFGSIQATDLIYLQHAATSAAYEGMLELARPNATNESVVARAQQLLDARELTETEIRFLPEGTDVSQLPPGQEVTIEVSVDVRANLSLSGFFITPEFVRASLVGTR
jgi:TadE-like protein